MYGDRILAFSNFLGQSPKSFNKIAQFLVTDTFREEGAIAIYLGELIETGVVCNLGAFGWSQEESAEFKDIPFTSKLPITEAMRKKEIVICSNDKNSVAEYPLFVEVNSRQDWKTVIAVPCYPLGGFAMNLSKKLELTQLMNLFFISIGSLIGLYSSRIPNVFVEIAPKTEQEIELKVTPLTDRQLVIASMLERGFTNAQIGTELGYSESLIRQETVAIYRKLQVTGKKDMQLMNALKIEQELLETDPLYKIA